MKFCGECGNELIEKECGHEGMVPFCPVCKDFRFPTFNSAISTVLFNPTKDKILMIQQYQKPFNILVAGYINKGENANEALLREVQEEVSLHLSNYIYNENIYFDKSNTLIHNYIAYADSETFKIAEDEVDSAAWFTIEDALEQVKPNSLAKRFLYLALHKTENSEKLFHYEEARIFMNDHEGNIVAEITFPTHENICEINHTFVDPSLRGLQIASKLVEAAIKHIESMNKKSVPVCSYAVTWFKKHKKEW